ncbi:tRNA (adenosine(37)-N6)-threonylcarbamoyltransferase complex transferase subunit TsaD [soil metagenome]
MIATELMSSGLTPSDAIGSDLILGIESSCDDTAAAVVDREGRVLSSVVASQVEVHAPFGGVYPEHASRAHVRNIIPVVRAAMDQAGVAPSDLIAIGVTRGPGLIGPLLVGLNTATGLGQGWGVPVVGVNHLRGHLRSADLEAQRVRYPAMVLLVSGGHTFLARMTSPAEIEMLGTTRDDSFGEAYDKVGRMLGLGYPGGPAVDRMAKAGRATIAFPKSMMNAGLEFSFSGLKSAVARHLEKHPETLTDEGLTSDVCASFVKVCVEVLLAKAGRALQAYPSESMVIVGGVSASPQIREGFQALCDRMGVDLCLPPLRWSTDNAAMIALAAFDYLDLAERLAPAPQSRLSITEY